MPTFNTHRTTVFNILRSPLLLRNLIYGSFIILALTSLIYIASPVNLTQIIPDYLEFSETPQKDIPAQWNQRAQSVKQAFLHAYNNYERYAAPHDELKPLTQGKVDKYVLLYRKRPKPLIQSHLQWMGRDSI